MEEKAGGLIAADQPKGAPRRFGHYVQQSSIILLAEAVKNPADQQVAIQFPMQRFQLPAASPVQDRLGNTVAVREDDNQNEL
jgi:hypothetical protein